MRIASMFVVGSMFLIAAMHAKADTWIPYTDGRIGGCWLNSANVLYGCTSQPAQSISNRDSGGYQPQNREDYCWQERQKLENANSSSNRTITSMRAAEKRFARSGCN